jgi:NADH-quinone oxidoreductase subunit C
MTNVENLQETIKSQFPHVALELSIAFGELTVEVPRENLLEVSRFLRDHSSLSFDGLMDLCGVDYLTYGISEWETNNATASGFERAVDKNRQGQWDKPRFAVVYHLLSTTHNHRVRLRAFVEGDPLLIDTVIDIWPVANWFEREAFDLYGIVFEGHPDLRRILTDYGFIGHPFRKDFPLVGEVEARYDAVAQRVIYEPVSIELRVLVPKVIRPEACL